MPAFFALFCLGFLLGDDLLPAEFTALDWPGRLGVVGALALLVGLVLLGLRYPLTRLLEGYPLEFGPLRRLPLRDLLVRVQQASYDRLLRIRDDPEQPSGARTTAARLLDRRFHRDRGRLLPTRFGNAYRAWENYPFTRYGLDAVAAWPRIDPLLSEHERELHTNAASDVALFVNGTVGAAVVGVLLLADLDAPAWAYPLPFAAAYVSYRMSIGAVERLGTERRAAVDLHRLELYDRLGVRRPRSPEDEREHVARAVNRLLLWGEPMPAALLANEEERR